MNYCQRPCTRSNLDPHLLFDFNALNLMLPKTKLYFMSSIMSGQPFLMLVLDKERILKIEVVRN